MQQTTRHCLVQLQAAGLLSFMRRAAQLVDHAIPHVPVRQWVLSLSLPLRLLLAAQPELVAPVLQVVQRVVTRHLLAAAGLKANEGHGGAGTLIQHFGAAANMDTHLHCLVLDGVYRCGADGTPAFVEVDAPSDDELHLLLQSFIARLLKMLTRCGVEGPGPTGPMASGRVDAGTLDRGGGARIPRSGLPSCDIFVR